MHKISLHIHNIRKCSLTVAIKKIFPSLRNPNLLTVEMRESMAVSVVASFPKMSQKPLQPEDQPWVNIEKIMLFIYPLCTFVHNGSNFVSLLLSDMVI